MFMGDMSQYQPEQIDFQKMKAILDAVILRDQHGYTIKDAHYDGYVKGCEAVGLPFMTYAFFGALDVNDAIAEADADIQRMSSRSQVAWIDIETVSVRSGKDADLIAAGNAYYDTLKKAGFQKVGLYSGEYFYNTHGLHAIKRDALWLAKYNSNDGKLNLAERPQVPCDLWQFTSAGAAAGVSPLDMSVIVGSKPLSWFTGAQVEAASTTTPSDPKATQLVVGAPIFESVPDVITASKQIVVRVESVAGNDVRKAPSHHGAYVRNTQANEVFDCYEVKQNEGDTWYAVSNTSAAWICSNNGHNAKELPYEHVNIVIPELTGGKLATIQSYIKAKAWWYNPTRDKDDAETIEVGIFTKPSQAYSDFTNYLHSQNVSFTEKAPQ